MSTYKNKLHVMHHNTEIQTFCKVYHSEYSMSCAYIPVMKQRLFSRMGMVEF